MSFPGMTNHGPIAIPGTSVVAYLAQRDNEPYKWTYSLWDTVEHGDHVDETYLASDTLDFQHPVESVHLENWNEELYLKVTPEQVARIAFLLSVEYT